MFHWEGADADGVPYRSQDFPTQADAEAWLTAAYPDLVDAGVLAVSLVEGARTVYGPMSLEA